MKSKLVLAAALALPVSVFAAEHYVIDSAHTYPNFEINHLGFSTMHGRFNKTTGALEIDWAKNSGSVDITIEAASIDTGFKKRDDHLRGPDFINAAEFPEITYKSTSVKINANKTAVVKGMLTIMDVSKPVTLNVKGINCGNHPFKKTDYVCGFDAEGAFKRSDFGVTYGQPAIGDEMKLHIEVEAKRK
ncbi:YceI family protein [Pseudomonadota bacterium]